MGIPGLTSYIHDNPELYLKPFELSDTYLVVDGSCISCVLYRDHCKSYSAFGGDYDEYYDIVKDFFVRLLKCKVKPIVIFDGAHERKKISTVLNRVKNRLFTLCSFKERFSVTKIIPLFLHMAFIDALTDLEIPCLRTELEADIEIATIARALNCPILSYDSDFYIFDALYISFVTIDWTVVKRQGVKNEYFLNCYMYSVNNFLEQSPNINKSVFPILATLLGNDYVQTGLFNKFFDHVVLPQGKMSYNQKKIRGVLQWLEGESVNSTIISVLNHCENKFAAKIMNAFSINMTNYASSDVSPFVFSHLNKSVKDKHCETFQTLKKKSSLYNFPQITYKEISMCKFPSLLLDIVMLETYFTSLQYENTVSESSHLFSLPLIRAICKIIQPYVKNKTNDLTLYIRNRHKYERVKLNYEYSAVPNNFDLNALLLLPLFERKKILCCILELNDNLEMILEGFDDTWTLFLMALLYWIKSLSNRISHVHIHALLLMAVANEVVQKNIGYYNNVSKLKKHFLNTKHKLNNYKKPAKYASENIFTSLLYQVTMLECYNAQISLIPLRNATEAGMGKKYSLPAIHLFSCFQSILYHTMILNGLLNYPFPHFNISKFYSGTLLFNIYINIKPSSVENFGMNLLKDAPNVTNVYKHLFERLCKFLPHENKGSITNVKKRRQRRKR